MRNLNAQVESAIARIARTPTDLAARENLLALLLSRTQYFGSFADFTSAQELVDETEALNLDAKRVALMRAQFLSSVHKFDEALKELDEADTLGSELSVAARNHRDCERRGFAADRRSKSENGHRSPLVCEFHKARRRTECDQPI